MTTQKWNNAFLTYTIVHTYGAYQYRTTIAASSIANAIAQFLQTRPNAIIVSISPLSSDTK